MTKRLALLAAAALGLGLSSGAASAGQLWPTSIVGTWNAVADQTSLTVTISSQAAQGKCRQITGTIQDNSTGGVDSLLGYYCPQSGRFHFLRTNTSGFTYQDYAGNVSDHSTTNYMGGTFSEVATASAVGEYAFFASR